MCLHVFYVANVLILLFWRGAFFKGVYAVPFPLLTFSIWYVYNGAAVTDDKLLYTDLYCTAL